MKYVKYKHGVRAMRDEVGRANIVSAGGNPWQHRLQPAAEQLMHSTRI